MTTREREPWPKLVSIQKPSTSSSRLDSAILVVAGVVLGLIVATLIAGGFAS